MSSGTLDRATAQVAAQSYLEARYPAHLAMTVMDAQPLAMDCGWGIWPQSEEYVRTHDPMAFVPAEPLLITAGPQVSPLPTAFPVQACLAALGLELSAHT